MMMLPKIRIWLCSFAVALIPLMSWSESLDIYAADLAMSDDSTMSITEEYKQRLVSIHKDIIFKALLDKKMLNYIREHSNTVLPMESILQLEQKWLLHQPLRERITQNPIALRFKNLVENKRLSFAEIMLTDLNGLLIASYPETTDYWQGDEDKFQQPVLTHDLYISEVRWDLSTHSYSFFYAKPMLVDGRVLAVLIAGLNVTREYIQNQSMEELLELDPKELFQIEGLEEKNN